MTSSPRRHRYAVNCSIIFTELPVTQRPAAAKAAGFDAVEFWWPFADAVPGDAEVDAFVAAVEDAGVQLVGLNFAAGDLSGGDRGLLSSPERSEELRANIPVALGIGERLGCRSFNALYGNRLEGVAPQAQDELAAENLALAARAAASIDGTVLLEPLSGSPRYPLRTGDATLGVIDRVGDATGLRNLGLLADLYHLAVNTDDVDHVIAAYTSRIAHVQVADAPGRNEPRTGYLPISRWLDHLAREGYLGWVGLEYQPSSTSLESFGWVAAEQRASPGNPSIRR